MTLRLMPRAASAALAVCAVVLVSGAHAASAAEDSYVDDDSGEVAISRINTNVVAHNPTPAR